MPGLLGAQRRQRPREHPDPRRARRRRVGDHRPEGVDDARAPRRLVLRRVPHRSRVDVAPRAHVPAVPDGPTRHRGAAAAPDDRELRVQRGVLRRRAHREGERARARSARAGRSRWRPSASSGARRSCRRSSRSRASTPTLLETAHKNGAAEQPALRDELAQRYVGLQVMKYNGMRMLTNLVKRGDVGPEASIGKLFWTTWHKSFGETAMRVLGADALTVRARAGRRLRDRRAALHLHGKPRGDHLRGSERDPTQHHR